MSVLETFYILFKSDADKAAAGLEKVDDAADKAEKSLKGADKATKGTATSAAAAAASTGRLSAITATADANAKRLATSFLGVAKAIAAPLLALGSATLLTDVITQRAEQIRELDQFSAKLNSTIGDVDAFQRSVQQLGGEGTKALDSLVKIGEKVNEAFADSESGARKDFEAWGLSFKNAEGNALGATEAMLALAGSIEGVSRAEGLARIKRLGIEDAATIELLLRGRKGLEDYMRTQKEMGVVTEEQAAIVLEYYKAWGDFNNVLTSIGNSLTSTFLPVLTTLLGKLTEVATWVNQNQDLVEGFFMGVAGILTAYMIPALGRMALATIAALWPWLAIAGAVALAGAAFALAYEDFKAWQEGAPSILGNLLGDFQAFVDKWQPLIDGMTWDWDAPVIEFDQDKLNANIEIAKGALSAFGTWIKDTLGGAVQWVIDLIKGIPGAVQAAVVAIPAMVSAGGDPTIPQSQSPASQLGASFGSGIIMPPGTSAGQNMLNGASGAPQGLATPATTNNTSTVSIGTVEVNTQATDAAGIAREVKGALANELRGTAAAFDDGVAK